MTTAVSLLDLLDATGDTGDASLAARMRGVLDQVKPRPVSTPDVGIRYVAEHGDDSNNGLSWASAKRTVYSAITSLPTHNGLHAGRVDVGGGEFWESEPWPIGSRLTITGIGAGRDSSAPGEANGGTRISRAHDGPLAEPVGTDLNHYLVVQGVKLDGLARDTTEPIWRMNRGGFNTVFRDVHFFLSKGVGLEIVGDPLNVQLDNVTFGACDGGALSITAPGDHCSFTWWGGQVDDCGEYPVVIEATDLTPSLQDTSMFAFRDVKFEGRDFNHAAIFKYVPNAGVAPIILLDGVWASSWPTSENGKLLAYEEAGSGVSARWVMGPAGIGEQGGNHSDTELFRSDHSGTDSGGARVATTPKEF